MSASPEGHVAPVLPWPLVTDAAAKLFTIWVDHHDLLWAEKAWALLPAVEETEHDAGSALAESLVTLMALALLSAQFADVACDERGHDPTNGTDDAIEALRLDSFYIGQLYPWDAPTNMNGDVDLRVVVRDLAVERTRGIVRHFSRLYPSEGQLLQFYAILRDEPDQTGETVTSELHCSPGGFVISFQNGCQIGVHNGDW